MAGGDKHEVAKSGGTSLQLTLKSSIAYFYHKDEKFYEKQYGK